jgi:gamma-glutamyltranspeptidase
MSETNADKNRLNQLQKIDTAKLSNAQKNEIKVLEPIVQQKESIINAPLLVPQTSSNYYSNIKTIIPLKFAKTNTKRLDLAKQFEEEGFSYLLNKDVDNAIISFTKSENSYNGYHMVYDIAIYLNKKRDQLSIDNIENWKSVYSVILSKYNWKIPEKYKLKLQEQSTN